MIAASSDNCTWGWREKSTALPLDQHYYEWGYWAFTRDHYRRIWDAHVKGGELTCTKGYNWNEYIRKSSGVTKLKTKWQNIVYVGLFKCKQPLYYHEQVYNMGKVATFDPSKPHPNWEPFMALGQWNDWFVQVQKWLEMH